MLLSLSELLEADYKPPKMTSKDKKPYKAPTSKTKPSGSDKNVGALIRHCMVAVARNKKNGKGGFTAKGANASWNICRWAMTKYGFMKGPYRKDDSATKSSMKMTKKGSQRNMQHAQGRGPGHKTPDQIKKAKKELPTKQRLFKRLFKYINK